jgi:hypothetical protein
MVSCFTNDFSDGLALTTFNIMTRKSSDSGAAF